MSIFESQPPGADFREPSQYNNWGKTQLCEPLNKRLPDTEALLDSVECQAHFVWNIIWRFDYGDGFLHASL